MSESDASVRGSNDRKLTDREAYQSCVARAFFSTDPVSEQGAFGDHDVEEALSSGSKDQLLTLAGALKLSDVDSKLSKSALAKLIRLRGVKVGAFVRDPEDILVFAATVQVNASSSAADSQVLGPPSPPSTPTRPKSVTQVGSSPVSVADTPGRDLESLRRRGKLAAAAIPPPLPGMAKVASEAARYAFGSDRPSHSTALSALQDALNLPPCYRSWTPEAYALAICHSFLVTTGFEADPELMEAVDEICADPTKAASVWARTEFFSRVAGVSARAHADAMDSVAVRALMTAARASDNAHRVMRWKRLIEASASGSMVVARLADLLKAETADTTRAEAVAAVQGLELAAVDFDSGVPLRAVLDALTEEHKTATSLCLAAKLPFTTPLIDVVQGALLTRSRATSEWAKGVKDFVRTHWTLLRGTHGPDDIVAMLIQRLERGVTDGPPTAIEPRSIQGMVQTGSPPAVPVKAATLSTPEQPGSSVLPASPASATKRPPTCHGCRKVGHVLRDCPTTPKVAGTDGIMLQSMLCYLCRANGHKASVCPIKSTSSGSAKNGESSVVQPSSTASGSSA